MMFIFLLVLIIGCFMLYGILLNFIKNLYLVKCYEVVVILDVLGFWDFIEGYIGYDIVNIGCILLVFFFGE